MFFKRTGRRYPAGQHILIQRTSDGLSFSRRSS
jgi:hypothetical protein